jgi:hypothetical protein
MGCPRERVGESPHRPDYPTSLAKVPVTDSGHKPSSRRWFTYSYRDRVPDPMGGSRMPRRDFIAGLGTVAAWPLPAWAQQGDRIRRIGVLMGNE